MVTAFTFPQIYSSKAFMRVCMSYVCFALFQQLHKCEDKEWRSHT